MPGFKINGEGGDADANLETFREHRFRLVTFMGKQGDRAPFLYVKDVTLPSKVIESLNITTPSATYQFAKSVRNTDLSITFYGTEDLINALQDMQDKVHVPKTGLADFNDYMDIIQLDIYSNDDLISFQYLGAWIADIQYGQLSYGSSNLKLITAIIKFQSFERTE